MKELVKKITLRPVNFLNYLFFNTYFWYMRKWYRLLPMEKLQGQKILVVVPHVDDEIIGLGGLFFELVKKNNSIKCLYVTNGAGSFHPQLTREKLIELREKEGRQVARYYGLEPPLFLELEDGAVELTATAVEKVKAELCFFRPQVVFLPYFLDGHRDHMATALLGLAALEKGNFGEDFPLYFYQTSSPFTCFAANRYFPLKEEFEGKKKALEIFKSQTIPFCGLLMLDNCRRKAIIGGNLTEGKIRGAEFFWRGNLAACKEFLKNYNININAAQQVRPMSSPFFLIRDYFSSWKLKKKIGRMLPEKPDHIQN